MASPKPTSLLLSVAMLSACSLTLFERQACRDDTDCGDLGGACRPDGYCEEAETRSLQVGMLYIGPVGDHGWTKAHDDSRIYFEANLDNVTAMFAPSVGPQDAPERIDEFVARGDNVVIGTSFDFLTAVQGAALRYPDVDFLLASGFSDGPNLGSYFGRMYQVMFQAGQLAAYVSGEGTVGIVGPVVIPETVRHLNAFTRGVRSVDPNTRVLVRWANAWFDPEEETAAAKELVLAGADVIFGHTDTTIPIETASDASLYDAAAGEIYPTYPIYTIGYDNPDSCNFAPDTCITSAYWNWGPLVTRLLGQMQTGDWDPSELPWEQMKADPSESTVYLAPISEALVDSATRIKVESVVDNLSEDSEMGRKLPFIGPVRDNTGVSRVAEGAVPTDADLLSMCWFVEGVYETDGSVGVVPSACVGDR